MKYTFLLTIPFLVIQCSSPLKNKPKDNTLERTKAIVSLVDSTMKEKVIDDQNTSFIIDSLKTELKLVKEESKNKTYILYRERNRFVYEMNEQKERNDFIVDSLKKRINSFTFLTVRKNDIPYKHTLIQDDNLRTE